MSAAFEGFSPWVFGWFAGLERDNTKAYFAATRDRFESEVRGGLEALLDELRETFGGEVKVFRQHRDLRFSADRTPYKTRTYGLLYDVPGHGAGLYAELSARGLYAGTGYHQLARDQLERYRAGVTAERSGRALADAVAGARAAGLQIDGVQLRTAPRGAARDHPRIELLRRTALIAGHRVPGEDGIGRDAALEHVGGSWRAARPITAWLDAEVGASTLPPARGGGRARGRSA
jgi:uncharacterized protein (TIGR02453 family)